MAIDTTLTSSSQTCSFCAPPFSAKHQNTFSGDDLRLRIFLSRGASATRGNTKVGVHANRRSILGLRFNACSVPAALICQNWTQGWQDRLQFGMSGAEPRSGNQTRPQKSYSRHMRIFPEYGEIMVRAYVRAGVIA